MNAADRALFYAINRWPDAWSGLMVFLSKGIDQTPVRIVLGLVLVALIWRKETRVGGLVAGLGWPIANELCDLWKLIPFARPGNELPDAILRVGMSQSMGTASAHSANMAFVAFAFTWYFRRWGAPWIVLAFLTGISRIYVGAHYPSQVLLGWANGCLAGWMVCAGVDALLRKRGVTRPGRPGSDPGGPSIPDVPHSPGTEPTSP